MGILFQDNELTIGLTTFRRRTYVTDRITGKTAYPSSFLINRLFALTQEMTNTRMTDEERAFVGPLLMHQFARAALDTDGLLANIFLGGRSANSVTTALMAIRGEAEGAFPRNRSASLHPWNHARRHDLGKGWSFWLNDITGEAWAGMEHLATPMPVEKSDLKKYFEVHSEILFDRAYLGDAIEMISRLQELLCMVTFNHRRETEFFRDYPADVIARRMQNYTHELRARMQKFS